MIQPFCTCVRSNDTTSYQNLYSLSLKKLMSKKSCISVRSWRKMVWRCISSLIHIAHFDFAWFLSWFLTEFFSFSFILTFFSNLRKHHQHFESMFLKWKVQFLRNFTGQTVHAVAKQKKSFSEVSNCEDGEGLSNLFCTLFQGFLPVRKL